MESAFEVYSMEISKRAWVVFLVVLNASWVGGGCATSTVQPADEIAGPRIIEAIASVDAVEAKEKDVSVGGRVRFKPVNPTEVDTSWLVWTELESLKPGKRYRIDLDRSGQCPDETEVRSLRAMLDEEESGGLGEETPRLSLFEDARADTEGSLDETATFESLNGGAHGASSVIGSVVRVWERSSGWPPDSQTYRLVGCGLIGIAELEEPDERRQRALRPEGEAQEENEPDMTQTEGRPIRI